MKLAQRTRHALPIQALVMASCFAASGWAFAQQTPTSTITDAHGSIDMPAERELLPLDDLRKFTAVFSRIKDAYVEEVTDSQLLESAIKGMLSELDPHSTYLAPKDYEDLEESTSGAFGGLGIEVGMENGFVKVITPIDDTPAQKAGVRSGDVIIKLGEQPVKGMSLQDAVELMRGEPGSILQLTIIRDGETGPLVIPVERAIIKVTSVKSRMLDDGYGYVRITQFQAETGSQFRDALTALKKDAGGALKGVVLDVRNNPGGVLQAAVDTVDAVLNEGLVVYTEGRIQSSRMRFSATEGDILADTPMVVLINGGSASASEIVAGALQDHHRAVVMGTQSFGKGSVQTVIPLDETHAIKMTTARYYTPDGRSIQATGIKPDIEVKPAELKELESPPMFTEADLSGHLEGKNEVENRKNEAQNVRDSAKESAEAVLDRDYQLRSALNLLKGLNIISRAGTSSTQQ
jgi:carboxyl-terminal processing protease